MGSYIVGIVLYFYQKPHLVQFFYNGCSCRIALHACKTSTVFVDGRVIVHHINNGQIVPLAHFKVVGVVCRRNLYNTRTKFHVNIVVGNDGHLPVHNGKHHLPAD